MEVGAYEILGELGRGGMGVVYRARHRELDHEVAIKVIRSDDVHSADLLARFRREAKAAAALAGTPGIVAVRNSGLDDAGTAVWLAMDLIDGTSLEQHAEAQDTTPAQAAELMAQVADAVAAANARGFIHRDLKPANVLVDRSGRPFVTDFGLVRHTAAGPEVTRLTRSGEVVGTPSYMAPEQVTGATPDARTDVYGLGATLFELLCGEPPFDGTSLLAVLQSVIASDPPWMRLRAAGVPGGLERILRSALAKEPDDRYATAAEFAADLRRFAEGEDVLARIPGRGGTGLVLLCTAAGVAIAGAVAVALFGGDPGGEGPGPSVEDVQAGRETAETVNERFRAYAAVDHGAGEAMARLYARWCGGPLSDAAAQAARAKLETALREAGPPAEPHAAAWRALARLYAGDETALADLHAASSAAGKDPFPSLLLARAQAAKVLSLFRLPLPDGYGMEQLTIPETDEMRTGLKDLEATIRRARNAEWWGRGPSDPYAEQLERAASALVDRDYDVVLDAATTLVRHPGLRPMASDLAALAHFQSGEHVKAGHAWSELAERLGAEAWPSLHRRSAQAYCWHSMTGTVPATRRAAADQAVHHADLALQHDPQDALARWARGSAKREIARSLGAPDGVPWAAQAVADADQVVAESGGTVRALHERAMSLMMLALLTWQAGDDDGAQRVFDRAKVDGDALVRLTPDEWRVHDLRGTIWELQGALLESRKRDFRPALRESFNSMKESHRTGGATGTIAKLAKVAVKIARADAEDGIDPSTTLDATGKLVDALPAGTEDWRSSSLVLAKAWMSWGGRQRRTRGADPTTPLLRAATLFARAPDDPTAIVSRATALVMLLSWSKKVGALEASQTALALEATAAARAAAPNDINTWLMSGITYRDLERWDEALAAFDRCLQIDPGHRAATLMSREVRALRGD